MAGDLLGSQGFAIGLTAKAPDYANIYLAKDAERQRQQAAKAKKAAADDEDLKKLYKEITINAKNIHRVDEERAKEIIAGFINKTIEGKKNNPNGYMNDDLQKSFSDAMLQFDQLHQRKVGFDKLQADIQAQQKNRLDTPAESKVAEILVSGSLKDAEDYFRKNPDLAGTIGFDPTTGSFVHNPIPNVNINEIQTKSVSNDDLKTEVSSEIDKGYSDMKGGRRLKNSRTIADSTADQIAQQQLRDPNNFTRYVYDQIQYGTLPPDFYLKASDPDQRQAAIDMVQNLYKNDLKNLAGTKIDYQIQEPFAPRASDADGIDENQMDELNRDVNSNSGEAMKSLFTVNFPGLGDVAPIIPNEKTSIELSNSVPYPKNAKRVFNGTIPTGTTDIQGNRVTDAAPVKNGIIGGGGIAPFDKKTGNIIKNDELAKLKQEGKTSNVEYRPVQTVTVMEQQVDEKGKTKEISTGYFVPMKNVENILKQTKVDHEFFNKKAAEKNKELHGQTQPKQETKNSWDKYKRK